MHLFVSEKTLNYRLPFKKLTHWRKITGRDSSAKEKKNRSSGSCRLFLGFCKNAEDLSFFLHIKYTCH